MKKHCIIMAVVAWVALSIYGNAAGEEGVYSGVFERTVFLKGNATLLKAQTVLFADAYGLKKVFLTTGLGSGFEVELNTNHLNSFGTGFTWRTPGEKAVFISFYEGFNKYKVLSGSVTYGYRHKIRKNISLLYGQRLCYPQEIFQGVSMLWGNKRRMSVEGNLGFGLKNNDGVSISAGTHLQYRFWRGLFFQMKLTGAMERYTYNGMVTVRDVYGNITERYETITNKTIKIRQDQFVGLIF